MMNTPRRGYAPKITASNFLQLSESQISVLYLKNMKNSKTTKIEPLNSRIWEGNHSPKNHQWFPQISPIKSLRARFRKHPKKTTKRGLQKSQPRKPGTTQQGLEEPRQIIYTYQEGSFKV
jgi:hypothetical protein